MKREQTEVSKILKNKPIPTLARNGKEPGISKYKVRDMEVGDCIEIYTKSKGKANVASGAVRNIIKKYKKLGFIGKNAQFTFRTLSDKTIGFWRTR